MGFANLVVLSLVMTLSTGAAAYLPTRLNLNPKSVRLVSLASTGILIGAALAIVIPEGVEAVYSSSKLAELGLEAAGLRSRDEHGHDHDEENASWVGGMLLAGFIFMYLIESAHSHSTPSNPHPHHDTPRTRATLASSPVRTPLARSRSSSPGINEPSDWSPDQIELGYGNGPGGLKDSHFGGHHGGGFAEGGGEHLSTVVGLLAHSLADGLSLGASALGGEGEGNSGLALIVFVAIMLHKAPAAFALSSILLSSSTSPAFARRSLIAFSLSAPLAALATYVGLASLGTAGGAATGWWTGMALVFSGGTFLYVAVQVNSKVESGEEAGAGATAGQAVGERVKMGVVLGGMVTPFLLSKLAGHGH